MSSSETDREFCVRILPAVSRTLALTIRLLGPRLRHQVLVAYLLCRVARMTTILGACSSTSPW